MGEIKSVKVDNWGVFFLQKLQNFFNKTDYCDLTLQFRDNSQLKVHRLVLSACTDYFNVLEQTCDIVDDALIMPNELQADVVVPIVNFMYTGTLEFELKMYGKLLRTAKEMNMTVLLKLLEAHRRTMEGVSRAQRPPSPKGVRRRGPFTNNGNVPATQYQQTNAPNQRRVAAQPAVQTTQQQPQRRVVQMGRTAGQQQSTGPQYRQQIGGVSIVKTSSSPIRAQYGNTTVYETQKEIKQEQMEYESHMQEPASPFEQLRKGYNNTKRPPTTSFVSPPAKKPNLEDVKEFAEQQRMRKQIAAEYGDDQEAYDNMLDDDIHNDDDDDDVGTSFTAPSTSTARQQQQQQTNTDEGTTTITFKHESGDKPPTIVVKDSSNSKMNHAKIIQEVLRQYPHLVKSNRNIKLKILPSTNDRAQRIVIKKEADDEPHATQVQTVSRQQQQQQQQQQQHHHTTTATSSAAVAHPTQSANITTTQQRQVHTPQQTNAHTNLVKQAAAVSTPGTQHPQKRRIDSKTMHALIALGAENTTGPWLCLRCGVDGRPISIPSYRGFRRHLVNTHKEHIDPALCEHCGWRSQNDRNLHFHIQIEHKIKSTVYTFEECTLCAEQFEEPTALQDHMLNSHPDDNKQQCIYCNKIFAKEMELYNHMKTLHKVQAIEDGIIDETDEEFLGSQDEDDSQDMQTLQAIEAEKKVQILSDITLPVGGCTYLKQDPTPSEHSMQSTEVGENEHEHEHEHEHEQLMAEQTADVTAETKFVTADGSEVILTEEERKQIMSQLNQEVEGGSVVMFLNEPTADAFPSESNAATSANDAASEEDVEMDVGETPSVLAANRAAIEAADEDNTVDSKNDLDDSQIYEELNAHENASELKNEMSTSAGNIDESKESIDNLEWAENLISEHDMEEETAAKPKVVQEQAKKDEDISKKLKELTGDWSDDENEEDINDDEMGESKAEHEDDEDEELKDEDKLGELVDAAQGEAAIEAMKLPNEEVVEDDIDLALKNLHKDDTNETHEQAEQKTQAELMPEMEQQVEEHSSDSTEHKTDILQEETEGLSELDTTPDMANEFIKEEATTALSEELHKTDVLLEDKPATSSKAETETATTDEQNDMLLDDLMNEAVTGAGVAVSSNVAEALNENEPNEQIVDEQTKSVNESSSNGGEQQQSAAVPTEKVQSLISEWGDDEDDEEEQEKIAAPNENDKK